MADSEASGSAMLKQLGLKKNPYVDRTAEKTFLDPSAFYLHSDLQGFEPSETTYIFFGRRGSGKTTIRLMMMQRYKEYNMSSSTPVFLVDLAQPGMLQASLMSFMKNIHAQIDNWDAKFADAWTSKDVADCILSCAIQIVMQNFHLANKNPEATENSERIFGNIGRHSRARNQLLLYSFLFAQEDSKTLNDLRDKLLPKRKLFWLKALLSGAALSGLIGGVLRLTGVIGKEPLIEDQGTQATVLGGTAAFSFGLGGIFFRGYRKAKSLRMIRAQELVDSVRVISLEKTRVELIANLLDEISSPLDSASTITSLYLGHNAQQKLELLDKMFVHAGYQGMAVFGDCFDEVGLLDPLSYPIALKAFAREVCRNEVLNQGRLHFFFPDSRTALDLSTERVVKEARFDRHFVRDLEWSRFQLLNLAEKRYIAARNARGEEGVGFAALFQHVSKPDFSAAISKLNTPRELMVFMTELFARLEAHAEDNSKITAHDMEFAITKAQSQSV